MVPMTNDDKKVTPEQLAKNDGKDGRPAWMAVDGVVYDATESRLWRNGTHVRIHEAGSDLTQALKAAPHPPERLDKLTRVGTLAEPAPPPPAPVDETPGFARLVYAMHAHPASVHFPIALCAIASLMVAVGLVIDCDSCLTVAQYNLALGMLLSPISIVSGIVDWKYQFGGRLTRIFQAKFILSVLFLVLGGLALVLQFSASGQPSVVYKLLVLAMAPTALGLGFAGGRITFPSA